MTPDERSDDEQARRPRWDALASPEPSGTARTLAEWGSETPAFDALIALGPVVIAVIVLAGRNAVTTTLAAAYVLGFLAAIAVNAARSE